MFDNDIHDKKLGAYDEYNKHIFLLISLAEGPIVCETVYETECQTSYHLHEVEEDQPKCTTQLVSYYKLF